MANYNNGLETRNKILDLCRDLFYEKGYAQTTFKDISIALDINQSAIHYHFKSKENILRIIYASTIKKNNDLVDFYSDRSTSLLAKTFFDLRLYLYKIWNDEKYRHFYRDATTILHETEHMYESNYSYYATRRGSDKEQHFYDSLACSGFDQSLLRYIDKNIGSLDFENMYLQTINMYKKILGISKKEFDLAISDVKVLNERCKWDELDTSLHE